MGTTSTDGLWPLLEELYGGMTHEQLVKKLLSIWEWHLEEKIKRNKKGGFGKGQAKCFQKVVAAEEYLKLIASGKTVSAQRLHDSLKAHYPKEAWNYNTIRGWHKLIKAALTDMPK